MRTIKVYVETDVIGTMVEDEFEIEDGATDDDIEKEAREIMFDHLNWWWAEVKDK